MSGRMSRCHAPAGSYLSTHAMADLIGFNSGSFSGTDYHFPVAVLGRRRQVCEVQMS